MENKINLEKVYKELAKAQSISVEELKEGLIEAMNLLYSKGGLRS